MLCRTTKFSHFNLFIVSYNLPETILCLTSCDIFAFVAPRTLFCSKMRRFMKVNEINDIISVFGYCDNVIHAHRAIYRQCIPFSHLLPQNSFLQMHLDEWQVPPFKQSSSLVQPVWYIGIFLHWWVYILIHSLLFLVIKVPLRAYRRKLTQSMWISFSWLWE